MARVNREINDDKKAHWDRHADEEWNRSIMAVSVRNTRKTALRRALNGTF